MQRQADFNEISDGRRYGPEDMVKADCGGCKGCHACCTGMGQTVVLDPYDIWRLETGLSKGLEELLKEEKLELSVVDGVILPNLKMAGEDERCGFLGADGRCKIHAFRPGICRLFPLGRIYEDGGFSYFLQVHECKKTARTKVKVKKWVDTPDLKRYDAYIRDWHYFLKELERILKEDSDGEAARNISLYVLRRFYMLSYECPGPDSFYAEFYSRLERAEAAFGTRRS